MNKYELLFKGLKKIIGADASRIIIYDVYCYDLDKCLFNLDEYISYDIQRVYTMGHNIIIHCINAILTRSKFIKFLEEKWDKIEDERYFKARYSNIHNVKCYKNSFSLQLYYKDYHNDKERLYGAGSVDCFNHFFKSFF